MSRKPDERLSTDTIGDPTETRQAHHRGAHDWGTRAGTRGEAVTGNESGHAVWPACEVCGKALTAATAVVSVDANAALHRHTRVGQIEREHPEGTIAAAAESLLQQDAENVLAFSPWRITCEEHVPQDGGWEIAGYQIDTAAKALTWWNYLSEKTWFDDTGWFDVVERLDLNDPSVP